MPTLALTLELLLLGLAFGLRSWLQRRATGSSGFRGISGPVASLAWWGGVLFVVALALGVLAPIADLAGFVEPIEAIDGDAGNLAGAGLAVCGIALTLLAQHDMGRSWRVGVDEAEQTALVTGGTFAIVRNPFFAALMPAALGLTLMVPNAVALAGLAALVAAAQLQVRAVEEPYLLRHHGDPYRAYAARVGRFVPGVGRLRAGPPVTTAGR
jgi:protein-S-isoprenylcysteine O-methyltransferase Ste14